MEEVGAMFFKLVLLKMSISIWPNRNSICSRLETDSVFEVAVRGHPMWFTEKSIEFP